LTAALPEQNHEIWHGAVPEALNTHAENDHQCGCRPLQDALHNMIVHLQAHIDRRSAEAAAPRIAAAFTRIGDAEHAAAAWRQRHDDAEAEHARLAAALRRRTASAERMVMRALVAIETCDDIRIPAAQREAWRAGWQACAAAVTDALNNPGTPATPHAGRHGRPAPTERERQVIDRQSPDYHG
jgi:hypothetical protein